MRYKVTISYDGTNYVGFQSQPNGPTIQDEIEKVIDRVYGVKLRIIMASRTDAGVHAKGQVFHFDIDKDLDVYRMKGAFNALLPKDIHVILCELVDESFHARFSVKEKTYEYLINMGEHNVFLNKYAYQTHYDLDVNKMKEAAKLYLGYHDFSSFNTSTYEEKPDQTRTISRFDVEDSSDGKIKITVTGDGFMRNMVRILVGTLIDVGRGIKDISDVEKMLEVPEKSQRRYNIFPGGLYLVKIDY